MTVTSVAGAPSACLPDWDSIDWAQIHKQVYRLQVRIAKAVREQAIMALFSSILTTAGPHSGFRAVCGESRTHGS